QNQRENMTEKTSYNGGIKELLVFVLREMRPRGKLITPFNVISFPIILLGIVLLVIRFTKGLGFVTEGSQDSPWGLWIGFNVVTGVALAGGAYVITFMVYIVRAEKYHALVRATVLYGFLAYVFYAGALLLDIGRPWKIINPIIGNSFGYSSVLFLVAWHFLLYMMAEFVEFSPVVAEWLGWKKVRRFAAGLTVGAVIIGITLSMLHQSGLGALFLMAKSKIHPLWYSEFLPILFLVSSIFAGLSMIILQDMLSRRAFKDQIDPEKRASFDEMIVGLGKGAAVVMFAYLFMKALVLIHGEHWRHLGDFWGTWYLIEVVGFVAMPLYMFVTGVTHRNLSVIRAAAIMTVIGIILNRLNVSMIAFKWYVPVRHFPSWMEIEVALMVIFTQIWVFRWVVNRMPVLAEPRVVQIQDEEAK
ncbi:MAG: polysulfide reductase NrfD, partial [Candidatus Latescibacterota bacterium]